MQFKNVILFSTYSEDEKYINTHKKKLQPEIYVKTAYFYFNP